MAELWLCSPLGFGPLDEQIAIWSARDVNPLFKLETPSRWWVDLQPVEDLSKFQQDDDVLELFGKIICQSLSNKNDCTREIKEGQNHRMYFFTNCRTIQVYCAHDSDEHDSLDILTFKNRIRQSAEDAGEADPRAYEESTKKAFKGVRHYLVWECVFPEGIDMEALSPRDANAQVRVKQSLQKAKSAPVQTLKRDKDHPPSPPSEVHEPPSNDRRNGSTYLMGRLLGKGGFAICHEGENESTREKFALKIVKSQMSQEKMKQKFQTELQIHSKMRHPNIVQFHRAFTFQQSTYIVLELCPNGSLMDMVKKRRFITEPEVRFYTVQMAGAIKYMHAKGIIHRDLKMGNIFLDEDMNIKIGDFGLAALLMSGKDMSACRRTTLCGTPNYIAPEILERGKKGHDHAVDIWSLGIIIFAMLTGKPPFQANSQDEIYRKAREREYDWPKLDTSENSICPEAKDLVSTLLVSPEDRPDPDRIVQHPFFSCGWVPQAEEMSPQLRDSSPRPNQFLSVGLRQGRTALYARNLKKLCVQSDVGPFTISKKIHSSTYREVAAEEKAGLTPAIPLQEGVVYRPFEQWLSEQVERRNKESAVRSGLSDQPRLEQPESSQPNVRPPTTTNRAGQQSFAAQQRAQHQPLLTSLPSRTQRKPTDKLEEQASRKTHISSGIASNASGPSSVSVRQAKSQVESADKQDLNTIASAEARIGAELIQQLKQSSLKRSPREALRPRISEQPMSIFNSRERPEFLRDSKPEQVLQSLENFHAELERALRSRSISIVETEPKSTPAIVVKWVDYTNKFGLGYILSNGSVGCIFRSSISSSISRTGKIPPTCVIVRDAERHLRNRGKEDYADRHQLVPISGLPIEFYENRHESGICQVKVDPKKFTVIAGKEGEPGKLSRSKDEFDDRKSEKIVLWNKFAKYMTAFGRDQEYPYDDALQRTTHSFGNETVVTFYQRFGDVGCWVFSDGCFQFNFPDHTKIVLSADATWCDFYHLPLEAARDLALNGTLSPSALDDRQKLSYPLQTLLNFLAKPGRSKSSPINPIIQGIPQANDFRKKVEFVRTIVGEWIRNGGLGNSNMDPEGRLRWLGNRELVNVKVPYKHVWVTVGARGCDDRRVAWFDPRMPKEIVPDIEAA